MKNLTITITSLLVYLLTACSTITPVIEDNQVIAQAVFQYSTAKYVHGDANKAQDVINFVDRVSPYVSNESFSTLDALETAIKSQINYAELKPEDALLVNATISLGFDFLATKVPDSVLTEADNATVQQVLAWAREAATWSSEGINELELAKTEASLQSYGVQL